MNVELQVGELEVGAVVLIGEEYYMVQSLPPCIEDYQKLGHRYYLHNLTGQGIWTYPTTLSRLSIIIAEAKGVVYRPDNYKLVLTLAAD